MRSSNAVPALLLVGWFLCAGCEPGYQRVGGEWAWVSYDAGAGRRVTPVGADDETFRVVKDQFGADRQRVYFEGRVVEGADPLSFSPLSGGYSRDERRVYFWQYEVLGAEPRTFEVVEFPYSRDANDVYCGTVPLGVSEPGRLEVVRGGGGVSTVQMRYLSEPGLADSLRAKGFGPEKTVATGLNYPEPALANVGPQTFRDCQPGAV